MPLFLNLSCALHYEGELMNWRRDGLVVWKPVRALLFADQKVFFWIKGKFGLSEYQMAALAWLKGLILGLLLGWWLL